MEWQCGSVDDEYQILLDGNTIDFHLESKKFGVDNE
jgi:hypothetical protein